MHPTAEKVHNQDLSALVTKAEEYPLNGTGFVKVRTFIEELILRLQKESQEEQSHDSWCKSEMSKAATLKTEAQVRCYEAAAELQFFRGLFSCVVLAGIRTFSGLKSLHASKLCADLLEAALDMRSDSESRVTTWVVLWFVLACS